MLKPGDSMLEQVVEGIFEFIVCAMLDEKEKWGVVKTVVACASQGQDRWNLMLVNW